MLRKLISGFVAVVIGMALYFDEFWGDFELLRVVMVEL
jgi:hypothetical protein